MQTNTGERPVTQINCKKRAENGDIVGRGFFNVFFRMKYRLKDRYTGTRHTK